jgi:hypothetical protein
MSLFKYIFVFFVATLVASMFCCGPLDTSKGSVALSASSSRKSPSGQNLRTTNASVTTSQASSASSQASNASTNVANDDDDTDNEKDEKDKDELQNPPLMPDPPADASMAPPTHKAVAAEEKKPQPEKIYDVVLNLLKEMAAGKRADGKKGLIEDCDCKLEFQRSKANNLRDKLDLRVAALATASDKQILDILYIGSGFFMQASTIVASILSSGKDVNLVLVDPLYQYIDKPENLQKAIGQDPHNWQDYKIKEHEDVQKAYDLFKTLLDELSKAFGRKKVNLVLYSNAMFLHEKLNSPSLINIFDRFNFKKQDPNFVDTAKLTKWREKYQNNLLPFDMGFMVDIPGINTDKEIKYFAEFAMCPSFFLVPHLYPAIDTFDLAGKKIKF